MILENDYISVLTQNDHIEDVSFNDFQIVHLNSGILSMFSVASKNSPESDQISLEELRSPDQIPCICDEIEASEYYIDYTSSFIAAPRVG